MITDYSEMIRHESSAAHLAQCTETLLEALSEARGFVVHGELGTPLVETLRFANDLLDVISDRIKHVPLRPRRRKCR